MKPSDILTPEVKSYVASYLMARAYAETMRAAVDKIALEILTECPIYADKETRGNQNPGAQILRSRDLYLTTNDALCADFYAEANKRERAAGLKKADMPDDHCPALVAESLQCDIEGRLIEASGRECGVTNHKLLCCSRGLERRQEWIDLVCKLVVNAPDFKNPLQKAA